MEFAKLRERIRGHIEAWNTDQNNLITDTCANASTAWAMLIRFVGSQSATVDSIAGNAVDASGVGGIGMYLGTKGQIAAVVLGAAAKATAASAERSNVDIVMKAVTSAIEEKRQALRNDHLNHLRYWNGVIANEIAEAEPDTDVAELRRLYDKVKMSLPLPGLPELGASKPMSSTELYCELLLVYANARWWKDVLWYEPSSTGTRNWIVDMHRGGI